jgi:hypothetical protein
LTVTERLPRFDEGHTEILLTIKCGPHAGTTHIYCTCGWEPSYKTKTGAIRALNQHRKLNGLPKTNHWSDNRQRTAVLVPSNSSSK